MLVEGNIHNFPGGGGKNQVVADLMSSGYQGTCEELDRKMGFGRKQVLIDDVIKKREDSEFSAEAQFFIKGN